MNIKDWGTYTNGNYKVSINLKDGTKIKYSDEDVLIPSTVDNFDLKITNQCDMNCPFCHEASTENGKHGDIMHLKFIENLHPYTEVAIGGGNPLCHPDLVPFLERCKNLKLIPSITVNQSHFEKDQGLIQSLVSNQLIYGLGVSLVYPSPQFLDMLRNYPNAVLHIINGVITEEQFNKLLNRDLKILILGYKKVRKGERLYNNVRSTIDERQQFLKEALPFVLNNNSFKVISFDNLALQQLDIKSLLSEEQWKIFYQGDDGLEGQFNSASMFVDAVTQQFAKNSCDLTRYPIRDTIEEMFQFLCRCS